MREFINLHAWLSRSFSNNRDIMTINGQVRSAKSRPKLVGSKLFNGGEIWRETFARDREFGHLSSELDLCRAPIRMV